MLCDFLRSYSWINYRDKMEQLTNEIRYRNIILYGYQGEGYFIKWFLDKYCGPFSWTIVDDRDYIFDCGVVKPIEISLGLVNRDKSILIVAKKPTSEVESNVNLMGFNINDEKVIVLSDLFQARVPFYAWAEDVKAVDFIKPWSLYSKSEMLNNYSAITERAIVSVEESLSDWTSVLDIGSGKGAAAAYFASCGKRVGLVEYDEKLADISKKNFSKLNLSGVWYEGDASALSLELDEWDCFYMYNSFRGKKFSRFVEAIKKSYWRNPRKIMFAYGNPYEGKMLIESGFCLKKRVTTDCSCRYWNLYSFV